MRKESYEFLQALQETPSPSGFEQPVQRIVRKRMKPIADRIKPRDVTVFHGAADVDKMNFVDQRMLKMVKAPTGDFRDWEAITSWATAIAEELKEPAAV